MDCNECMRKGSCKLPNVDRKDCPYFISKIGPSQRRYDAGVVCASCGDIMFRDGTCFTCPNCGERTGCS